MGKAITIIDPVTDQPFSFPRTAFGELSVAQATPFVQSDFRDNLIRTRVWKTFTATGTATAANSMAVLQTTAAANTYASIQSKVGVKYNAGQGGEARFTMVFDTPEIGSFQEVGIGDFQDGFFFGFRDDIFGTIRRCPQRNRRAITSITRVSQVCTVTTTANHLLTTGDMVSIIGNASTPVLENDYIGAFIITVTGATTFTYVCINSPTTPATGTFLYDLNVDNFNPQFNWSEDKMDGNGLSQQILTPTNNFGIVGRVTFQYLGFGGIFFFIENTNTGEFVLVDNIKYANKNPYPSLGSPTLPLSATVRNKTNSTNKTLKTASMAGFIQGYNAELGSDPFSINNLKSVSTTPTNVISIKCKTVFNGERSKTRVKLTNLNCYGDGSGTNPCTIYVYRNTTLGGSPSYTNIDATNSVMSYDIAGTTVSGGELIKTYTFGRNNVGFNLTENDLGIYANPDDVITFAGYSLSSVDMSVSVSWKELA